MVIDGVAGGISNASRTVYIDFIARLATRGDSETVITQDTNADSSPQTGRSSARRRPVGKGGFRLAP